MSRDEANRRLVGRVVLVSAVLLGILAVLCWTGVLPIDHGARRMIALALGVAAVADGMLGVFFLTRARHS